MTLATTALALRLGRSRMPSAPAHDLAPSSTTVRASAPVALVMLGVLLLAVPGTVYALTPHRGQVGNELVLIGLIIALSGARLSLLVAGRRIRIFESVLWAFYYAFFGIAPLVQSVSLTWPGTTPDLPEGSVIGAGLIILVSAVALLSGSVVLPGHSRNPTARVTARAGLRRGPGPALTARAGSWRAGRLRARGLIGAARRGLGGRVRPVDRGGLVARWRLWVAFGIFLAAGAVHYSHIGLSNIFESRQITVGLKSQSYSTATEGVIFWALTSVPLLCLAIALILNWRRHRPTLAGRAATVAVVVITAVVFNPLSNARFVFGAGVLGLVGALGAYATLTRYRFFVTGLLASIVVIFPYIDIARYDRQDLAPSKGGPLQALTSGDFDAFAQTANTWAYLQELGPTWGRQALGVVLFWVPRTLWPDKPEDTGILIAHFRQYSFTNLSAPLPSELIINFSWIGLIVICFLIGRALLRIDLLVDQRLRLGSTGPTLSYVLPFYMIILLRGSLLQAMAFLVTILASSWLLRFSGTDPESAPVPARTDIRKSSLNS